MPVTPFHFGPGAAINAIAPKHVSFLSFCMAKVITDTEPLYCMVMGQEHLHRFFHTYVGASVVALATVLLFLFCRWFAGRFWFPDLLNWKSLSLSRVVLGAVAGTFSHIVLDSIMHRDITPLAPFRDANPLFRIVSLSTLHWFCIWSGMVGMLILGIRYWLRERKMR